MRVKEASIAGGMLVEKLLSVLSEEELQTFRKLTEKLGDQASNNLELDKASEEVNLDNFQKLQNLLSEPD